MTPGIGTVVWLKPTLRSAEPIVKHTARVQDVISLLAGPGLVWHLPNLWAESGVLAEALGVTEGLDEALSPKGAHPEEKTKMRPWGGRPFPLGYSPSAQPPLGLGPGHLSASKCETDLCPKMWVEVSCFLCSMETFAPSWRALE